MQSFFVVKQVGLGTQQKPHLIAAESNLNGEQTKESKFSSFFSKRKFFIIEKRM